MEISSAAYDSLSPTELDNFKNPLRLPGDDGIMGMLDASNIPARINAQKESVEIVLGKRSELFAYHVERDGRSYLNPTIRVRTGKERVGGCTQTFLATGPRGFTAAAATKDLGLAGGGERA